MYIINLRMVRQLKTLRQEKARVDCVFIPDLLKSVLV